MRGEKSLLRASALLAFVLSPILPLAGATVTNWTAFNDHNRGTGTALNVTAYSPTATGAAVDQTVGGPLTNFYTGEAAGGTNPIGVSIHVVGRVNGVSGGSTAPNAGTPVDQVFAGKIDWRTSAFYFAGDNVAITAFTMTFTNLTPGATYNFKGTAVRGSTYATRWTLATIAGISSATAAHITGTWSAGNPGNASPGIVTNGWSPYGNTLAPGTQAAWNSGENRSGDLIVWTDIVPSGNSFSVICSNWIQPTPAGAGNTTYCYAFGAIALEEVIQPGPLTITQEPTADTNVEEFRPWSLSVRTSGAGPRYQWYKGDLETGTPIPGATSAAYGQASASLGDSGNYFVIVTNDVSSVTSILAHVTVYVEPLVITQQPTNALTVVELRPFTLSVTATGTVPHYQWYREDMGIWTPLPDATNRTYSVASASLADGGNYVVVITNSLFNVTSFVAQVTVSQDREPPVLLRAVGNMNFDHILLEFNEPLDFASATDLFSYGIPEELGGVSAVSLTNNNTAVLILTGAPQAPNTLYTVEVLGVGDVLLNTAVTNMPFRSWATNLAAGINLEVYPTGGGTAVSNLTQHPSFPDHPRQVLTLTNFDTTSVWPNTSPQYSAPEREGYGGRLRALFFPPLSGAWRFFIRSDDSSELWLNPAGPSAAGRLLIAQETNCCNAFLEPPNPQTSAPFDLVAGQGYYLEALYKEGNSADFCQVAARREGDTNAAASLLPIGGGALGLTALPAGAAGQMAIVQPPVNTTVEAPNPVSFSIVASNSLGAPFSYQWQQNDGSGLFTNLPGAQMSLFTKLVTSVAADNGAQFRCVVAAGDSSVVSDVVMLTVTPDATGPVPMAASRAQNQTNILVTFAEPVLAEGATNAGNYLVCDVFNATNCLGILSAVITNNATQVLLETAVPDPALIYRLSIVQVTDVWTNAAPASNGVVVSVFTSFQQGTNGYTGTVDTHVRQDNPTTAYGTNTTVLIDNLSPLSHGLLRFENIFGGGAGQIPLDALINSAILRLRTDNASDPVRVHRLLAPWSVTNTWNNVGSPNDGVSLAAGDAVTIPELTFASGAVGDFTNLDLTASVRFWATNGGPNYGWGFIDSGDDGYQFNSSEYATVDYRPLLTVSYTPSARVIPVGIVTQPAATNTLDEGQTATFSVTVTGTQPAFQWFKDDVAIPGANGATLAIPGVVETNAGRYYCVATNFAPSSLQSADAWLTVRPDTNAPVLLSALGLSDTAKITLAFSKPMGGLSVSNLAHYAVVPALGGAPLGIIGAELATNGTTVTLLTSARTPFTHYELMVTNVTDAAYRQNVMPPIALFLPSEAVLVPAEGLWWFEQSGVAPPPTWTTIGYDDSDWSSSNALFVAKRGIPGNGDLPIQTMLSLSNNAAGSPTQTITYYFRTYFTMPTAAALAGVQSYRFQVHPILDDGAAFYINGQLARRVRLTNEVITYDSLAQGPAQGTDYRFEGPYDLPTTNVLFGRINVLAVEVHQQVADSSDIAFAAELLIQVPALQMRLVVSTDASGNLVLTWPPVPGYTLYQANNLSGPYTPVPGNPSGAYTVPTPLAPNQFYRLQNP